jgi:hypothetical protein
MNMRMLAAAAALLCLLTQVGAAAAADDATLLRVFLRDGTSLVSYGEFARVADRVIFSLPISSTASPSLQLVNIPAQRVDWDRTNRYADAARAAHYIAAQGEADYLALSNAVSRTLNDVAFATDPAKRLEIVEAARTTLAEWPHNHFNFRSTEVRQMLSLLDEAIADLRAASGGSRFDLSLVAVAESPAPDEALLPPPTPIESIDQLLAAAELTESPTERTELMKVALGRLEHDQASLPRDWLTTTRARAKNAIATVQRIDRASRATMQGVMAQVTASARRGDVRSIARVLETLRRPNGAFVHLDADAVAATIAEVEAQLDGARRLRLARDRWEARAPALREYIGAMSAPLTALRSIERALDDIKELAGSTPAALALVQRQTTVALAALEKIVPPEECRSAHAVLTSAAHLARNAAVIRREAALAGDIMRAWDASSAASGALMLSAKARTEIQALSRPPQPQ